MALKPFLSFYGGKWRVAPRYPDPVYDRIIEPFAGGAGYSVRHHEHKVRLYEIDPIIFGVWDYLIHVKASEVLALPTVITHVDDLKVSAEAKSLIGFWLNKAVATPRKQPSAWMRSGYQAYQYWGEEIKERIARQVDHIRHWRVFNKSYDEAPDDKATWFIDPPYQGRGGKGYRFKITDYVSLGRWCRERSGQVMVCENTGADWLPFEPFMTIKATAGHKRDGVSREVIWTNEAQVQRAAA